MKYSKKRFPTTEIQEVIRPTRSRCGQTQASKAAKGSVYCTEFLKLILTNCSDTLEIQCRDPPLELHLVWAER